MGESTVPILQLKKKIDLRKLLDGYETLQSRQKVIRGDYIDDDISSIEDRRSRQEKAENRGIEYHFHKEVGQVIAGDVTAKGDNIGMQNNNLRQVRIENQVIYNQYGTGDNFAGDEVEGNKFEA
jgi:hypothetical protein